MSAVSFSLPPGIPLISGVLFSALSGAVSVSAIGRCPSWGVSMTLCSLAGPVGFCASFPAIALNMVPHPSQASQRFLLDVPSDGNLPSVEAATAGQVQAA